MGLFGIADDDAMDWCCCFVLSRNGQFDVVLSESVKRSIDRVVWACKVGHTCFFGGSGGLSVRRLSGLDGFGTGDGVLKVQKWGGSDN